MSTLNFDIKFNNLDSRKNLRQKVVTAYQVYEKDKLRMVMLSGEGSALKRHQIQATCKREYYSLDFAKLKELYEKLAERYNKENEEDPNCDSGVEGLRMEKIKRDLNFPDDYINHEILDMDDVMQYYTKPTQLEPEQVVQKEAQDPKVPEQEVKEVQEQTRLSLESANKEAPANK